VNYNDDIKHNINKDIENATSKYYYNSSTVMKYLRKVLNEINHGYMDSGLRTGFIMKRYIERYKINPERGPKLVLLCLLKDIGLFYQDDYIPKDNHALAAASSFLFLNYCSPLKEDAKPLFYYKAKYIPDIDNEDYKYGLLMTLINQIIMYNYQEYTLEEMEELLRNEKNKFDPEQVRNVIKLLKKEEDILEKLNNKTSLYIYETQNYILQTKYTDEELLGFINTTNFSFEFHNHETLAHTVTVAVIARALAKKSRLPDSMCEEVYLAGLVHDIGKIRVPKDILCFPGRLEGDMLKEMQRHVVYTKEILEGSFSYKIVDIASNHHEKLDGSGYPRGLRAIDLSIGDKIIAVADIASALYCKRSYKTAFPPEKIMGILESDAAAGKLDKRIVEHLVDNYDEIMGEAKERETIVLKMYSNMKEKYEALKKSNVLYHFFDKNNNGNDNIFDDKIKIPKEKEESETTYGELDKNYNKDDFEVISTNIKEDDEDEDIEEKRETAAEIVKDILESQAGAQEESLEESDELKEDAEEAEAEETEESFEEQEEIQEEETEALEEAQEEIEEQSEDSEDENEEESDEDEDSDDDEESEEDDDDEEPIDIKPTKSGIDFSKLMFNNKVVDDDPDDDEIDEEEDLDDDDDDED
jgi:HD-GYP domain-containing protein (c-di-GMP phosphodiesterase class II)